MTQGCIGETFRNKLLFVRDVVPIWN